jgi:hypothetical protein
VEMSHGQREEVAVGLRAHAGYAPRVCQQADLAEVGAVAERGGHLTVAHHNVHNALLNICRQGEPQSTNGFRVEIGGHHAQK